MFANVKLDNITHLFTLYRSNHHYCMCEWRNILLQDLFVLYFHWSCNMSVIKYDFVLLEKGQHILRCPDTMLLHSVQNMFWSLCPLFQMWPSITFSSFSFQQPTNQESLKKDGRSEPTLFISSKHPKAGGCIYTFTLQNFARCIISHIAHR